MTTKKTFSEKLQEKFLENKFIGMLVIMLSTIVFYGFEFMGPDAFGSIMLYSFLIFSGGDVLSIVANRLAPAVSFSTTMRATDNESKDRN